MDPLCFLLYDRSVYETGKRICTALRTYSRGESDQEPGKIHRQQCRPVRRPESRLLRRPQCKPECWPVYRPEYRAIPWPECRQERRPISRQRKKCCSWEQRQDGPRESFSDVCGDWTTDTYLLEHKNPWAFWGDLQPADRNLPPQMSAGVGRCFFKSKNPLSCPDHP